MKDKATVAQGLAWAAWIAFLVSLFLPVHWFTYPIIQKFSSEPVMYGWKFALTFLGDMFLFLFLLIPSGFDIESLVYLVFTVIYNLGNMLLILAPLLPNKFSRPLLRKIHLRTVFVCTLAAIAYKYVENIQLGYSLYSGYYVWVLAYTLLLIASILMLGKNSAASGMEKE
ncbi:MAG: hypothetical protein JW963_01715 [Anaerolineales bacterium]|nr:hypothetical protein [Anaerolineales bacterium]